MRESGEFFISGYIMPPRNDKAFSDLKESGLNHIYIDYTIKDEIRETALDFCDKYGLKAIIMSCWGRMDNPSYKRVTAGVKKHPSFAGVNGLDEPLLEEIDDIEKEYISFKNDFPEKTFYTNMVNRGVPIKFVTAKEGKTHADLMERYAALVEKMDYGRTVSMTIYPLLHAQNGASSLAAHHLMSLYDLSVCAKKTGADMYHFIQAMPFRDTHRKPEEADIRFQVNCGLAFGAKGVQYFCYRTPDANWEFNGKQFAMVTIEGEKTDIYYSVQKVNKELFALEEQYFAYSYERTYAVKGGVTNCGTEAFNAFYKIAAGKPEGLSYVYSTTDCVIGEFGGKGKKAYYFVNYTDPAYGKDCYVEFAADCTGAAYAVIRGETRKIYREHGRYCLLLKAGEGAFVTFSETEEI